MTDDELRNSVLAAGAVMAALWLLPSVTRCEPLIVHGEPMNVLEVRFEFLKSLYRVTVAIVPETEEV